MSLRNSNKETNTTNTTFWQGVLTAAGLALLTGLCALVAPIAIPLATVGLVYSSTSLLSFVLVAPLFTYFILQLRNARLQRGRLAATVAWFGITAVCVAVGISVLGLLAILVTLGWLTRGWFQLTTPLQVLADLTLWIAATVVALMTFAHTHSFALTAWCFFLTLALWPVLAAAVGNFTNAKAMPIGTTRSALSNQPMYENEFTAARSAAARALQQLQQINR